MFSSLIRYFNLCSPPYFAYDHAISLPYTDFYSKLFTSCVKTPQHSVYTSLILGKQHQIVCTPDALCTTSTDSISSFSIEIIN